MDNRAFLAAAEAAFRSHARTPGGRRLTALHVKIAAKLAHWKTACARQRALARSVGCSVRTVQRALVRLHQLGLLSWTRRVVVGSGWRAQITNAYAFLSCKPLSFLRLYTSANLSPPGDPAAARAALAEIARRRAAVLASDWRRRHG